MLTAQAYGFSPVWINICRFNCYWNANLYAHSVHLKCYQQYESCMHSYILDISIISLYQLLDDKDEIAYMFFWLPPHTGHAKSFFTSELGTYNLIDTSTLQDYVFLSIETSKNCPSFNRYYLSLNWKKLDCGSDPLVRKTTIKYWIILILTINIKYWMK